MADPHVSPEGFGLGWKPEAEVEAREKWAKSGQPFAFGASAIAVDDRPIPEAFSLSGLIRWHHNQGPVGECYDNAAAQLMQVVTAAENVQEETWESFQVSRVYIGHQTCIRDSGGRPYDVTSGGSITNALRALDEAGAPHEALYPYYPPGWTPQSDPRGNALGRYHNSLRPTEAGKAEGLVNQLTGVVDCELGQQSQRLIINGHPPEIGIWWPYGWDTAVAADGRVTGIGRGQYGHALLVVGFDNDWDGQLWWEIENSHGPIYRPIPAARQSRVIGYKPATDSASFSFWVRDDLLKTVMGYGNAELIAAAGMTGFRVRPKLLEWGGLLS